MASEKSFLDRAQRGRELSAAVALLAPPYAPVETRYTLTGLNTAVTTAETANANVETKRIIFTNAASERAALVKTIGPLITQAVAHVKSNTAWANRFDALKNAADKVRGVRPPAPKPADPDPDAKKRESGERSFVEIAAFLKSFIERLEGLTGYAPQDPKIGIPALIVLWTALDDYNKSIPGHSRLLADAISDRLSAFTGPAALKFVFDGVKVSVKGQYGQSSPQYQAIRGMSW